MREYCSRVFNKPAAVDELKLAIMHELNHLGLQLLRLLVPPTRVLYNKQEF